MVNRIVGLSGYAQSGKDTAAQGLIEIGFTRIAFADILRQVAYALDPYVNLNEIGQSVRFGHFQRLSRVIDNQGWDIAKEKYPDVRRTLQRLGTEAGRDILGTDIWVNTALDNAHGDIVVTDVRFPNEVRGIEERGGIVIRIIRPGIGPKNDHASETSLDNYDFNYWVTNDGTSEQLQERVVRMVRGVYNEHTKLLGVPRP